MNITKDSIAAKIDHTILGADVTPAQIDKLCEEAEKYGFASVCVNPSYVRRASDNLKKSDVDICTVIGFPLGASSSIIKKIEARDSIAAGAVELDMVMNIGKLKAGLYNEVLNDIKEVVSAGNEETVIKVIIETCYLNKEEKMKSVELIKEAGADFVKTSTGFGTGGATLEDIKLLAETAGDEIKIKASGGIKNFEFAKELIENGADRLGMSSGVEIIK